MIHSEIIGPDLGARLREARRGTGLSQAQVAVALSMSRPTYIALEQGKRPPSGDDLVRLAALFGRQVHELVRPGQPVEAMSARFRLSEEAAHSETGAAVSDLQRIADDLLELEQHLGMRPHRRWPSEYDSAGLPPEVAAEQVADAERARLGLGDGPLAALRELLEDDLGIRVFSFDMPSKVAGMFVLAEPAGACIGLNARHPHERQRWSLAHEYGHFLMHRAASEITDVTPGRRSEERMAEAFAGCFLMPRDGLVRRYQQASQSRGEFTPVELFHLADTYEVSPSALAFRLEGLGLIRSGWWDRLTSRGLKVQAARASLGIADVERDTHALPRRVRYFAFDAYLRGELSEGRLARSLRIDRVQARELAHRLLAAQDVAPEGDVEQWTWAPEQES